MTPVRRGLPVPAAAGVRAASDRHFRRPEVRPGRRRASAAWRRAGLWLALFAAAAGLVAWVAHRIIESPSLAVHTIVVRGNVRLPTPVIQSLVDDLHHESILRVDLNRYRKRLMDSPWVSDATLWRVLPSTVEIQVVERTPLALARQEDLLYLVDDTGTIIDEFGPQYRGLDLPVVDGLLPPAATEGGVDPARVRLTTDCLEAIAAAPDVKARVSQIDVSDAHDVIAVLDGDPVELHLGDEQFVERLRRYLQLGPALERQVTAIDAIDLRFDDRLFVRPAARAGSAAVKKNKGQ